MRIVLVLVLVFSIGCSSLKTYKVDPKQLTAFDTATETNVLRDKKGFSFSVDTIENITITLTDGRRLHGDVDQLDVTGTSFTWVDETRTPRSFRGPDPQTTVNKMSATFADVTSVEVERSEFNAGPVVVVVFLLAVVGVVAGSAYVSALGAASQ